MKPTICFGSIPGKATVRWQVIRWIFPLAVLIGAVPASYALEPPPLPFSRSGRIPISEFVRLVQESSEPGGYFESDNFTSNEILYLHITGKLQELGISGGAYIGVGPEQNFSYIAKIRPQIAFIVDIRRQAIIQHLLYKALFHLADNRAQFLAWLFSKPVPKIQSKANDPLDQMLNDISHAPTTREAFLANLATVQRTIEQDFSYPLSSEDVQNLRYIYNGFWEDNLDIGFRFGVGVRIPGSWGFPSLRDLILATGADGRRGNFLAREKDYQFVRKLQEANRIIPVVGDLAGSKALSAVADYLRSHNYSVTAFYVSNVEEYLYANRVFDRFAENVRKLPISDKSVLIRAVRAAWNPQTFWARNDRITPFLQNVRVFLTDFDKDLFPDYGSLVNTDFIPVTEQDKEYLPAPAR